MTEQIEELIPEILKRMPPQSSTPFDMTAYAKHIAHYIRWREMNARINEINKAFEKNNKRKAALMAELEKNGLKKEC